MGVVSGLLFPELVIITFSTYSSPFHMETKLFFYLFNIQVKINNAPAKVFIPGDGRRMVSVFPISPFSIFSPIVLLG
jgi:hypothetical protein